MKPKELRNQLRQIVKEMFPELVKEVQLEELSRLINSRLDEIEKSAKAQLHEMNERQKDTLSYLVRTVTVPKKD